MTDVFGGSADSAVVHHPALGSARFQARGPQPLEKPLGTVALLRALRANPIATWTHLHFDKLVLSGESILGKVVVLSDPALIRHVLVDNAANYPKDRLQHRVLGSGPGTGLLLAEGDVWRRQRRALAPLFSPRVTAGFQVAMADVADDLIQRWSRQRDNRPVDVGTEMARTTLRVLARTIFSDGLTRRTEEFTDAVTRYLEAIGKVDPLDILDMPAWLPRLGRLQARPVLKFFDAIVTEMIDARRASIASTGEAPQDLLTLLLQAADPETGHALSEADVKANIVTFITAGHETTSNTLTWALYLISRDRSVRDALEAEVDAVGAESLAGAIDRLPVVRAVLDEALRLYPPAAVLTRDAAGPDRLGELRIKAGTRIVISPWVLHRHRKLWDDPDVFDPARFLPANRGRIDRFAYLPFGAGPRVCIGSAFALQEAIIILATILRSFRLDLVDEREVLPLQRVTLRPSDGLSMVVRRR